MKVPRICLAFPSLPSLITSSGTQMYYGVSFHFSKDKHPQACAQWFEKAKAAKKDAWLKGVNKIMKE